MIPFDWVEPESLKEAVSLLDPSDSTVRPVSGGTALMLMMKPGIFVPSRLVSLARIEPEHSVIALEKDGQLRVGAMASLAALERSAEATTHFPVMKRAIRTLSNIRVRNVARVGGALAHGDPHMDLPPLFATLGARVSVVGPDTTREIAVEDLYLGYYQTVLKNNELIAEAIVPPLNGARAAYVKVTSRAADDWPALCIGVRLDMADTKTVRGARVVIGAASERVTRLSATEKLLSSMTLDAAILKNISECAAAEARFIPDAHGSASYKRELLRVYLARAIQEALA
ncbi:MAG TPA: FAD binding domain-containing protein [Micropepsaceae bacterium]|jgi:carbon-monoxide dehydrogenase medium subunit|nr:FAD binding domain-containing protein [Micropepsaceae bacterium]